MTPFTGESTDSEAEIIDSDSSPKASPSGFKSYIQDENKKTSTLLSERIYDQPFDCLPNVKRKETWFTNRLSLGKTSTMKASPKLLKKCAPYTEENMRTVC